MVSITDALFTAIRRNDIKGVKDAIAAGANLNAKGSAGWTPLHWAASYGCTDIVNVLITEGADVNAKDRYGRTPLHEAAFWGRREVILALLDAGADVNARTKSGWTPLCAAARYCHVDVMKLLLSNGADKTIMTTIGHTAYDFGDKLPPEVRESLKVSGNTTCVEHHNVPRDALHSIETSTTFTIGDR